MNYIDIKKISERTNHIFEKYGLEYAGVFGSYARGDNTEKSDVDILFKPGKTLSLFDIVGLKDELSEVLENKVDLISEKAVVSYFRDYILKDLKLIYGKR